MGGINSGKRYYNIDEGFFKSWTPNMAYMLGFTCADGNIYKKTLSWDLSIKSQSNLYLLKSFNKSLNSDYPIVVRPLSYRLKISNAIILEDIKKLGILPNKTKILSFPYVHEEYLRHFIRGFLDGDGWITTRTRADKYHEICVGFSNGSHDFMSGLIKVLRYKLGIDNFNLRCREKKTKRGMVSKTYQLEFYAKNAKKILSFLYEGLSKEDIFLERKYYKYLEAIAFFNKTEKIKSFGRKWINVENIYGKSLDSLLKKHFIKDEMLPKDIARELRISLSTLYRWLNKSEIRLFEKRGSQEWSRRILRSKGFVTDVK